MNRFWTGLFLVFFSSFGLQAQEIHPLRTQKIFEKPTDTLQLETSGINPFYFEVTDSIGNPIPSNQYQVNFPKGKMWFVVQKPTQKIVVKYQKFPDFITQSIQVIDSSSIVSNEAGVDKIFTFNNRKPGAPTRPLEGLQTSGSIVRGVTIGNNQNAVVNSNLDLQISGNLSEKVGIRAALQDNNLALQNGAYSQRIDEFDQIYLEVFSKQWNLRGGDLFLENRTSRILNFNKKVQGLSASFQFGEEDNQTQVMLSGSLVRGQYARSTFIGAEGNQGPYKLIGNQGELFVLVISGSERVFVNGVLLQRGENNQYIIDYNAGEITFTSLFPISSEMRINVEYQYTERNYNRLITYNRVKHQREKWYIETNFYLESDSKNQPLQQNLSPEQVQILQNAGNDPNQMFAVSAVEDTYSENKILYRKIVVNGVEVFDFSTDATETLYQVRFTLVGANQGNYQLLSNQAIGRIYGYVAPVNGIPQGDYEPVIRLIPPTKTQMVQMQGGYQPTEKTQIKWDVGVSNYDANLFSEIGNENNHGVAGILEASHQFGKKNHRFQTTSSWQWVQQNFRPVERLFSIEFERDWNLTQAQGNQSLLQFFVEHQFKKDSSTNFLLNRYEFQKLDFSESYSGQKHRFFLQGKQNNFTYTSQSSWMKSTGSFSNANFLRSQNQLRYRLQKNWVQFGYQMEDVQEQNNATQALTVLSQRFHEVSPSVGRGDTTKVFVNVGMVWRVNDSIRNQNLQRVNQSYTYFLKSRILQKDQQQLSWFVHYRDLLFADGITPKQSSLNSRLLYQDQYFGQLLQNTTSFENTSGTIAQQEFTYVQVEPGLGVYMWIDYNGNGIQELQEFEVAPFPDQANYVRIFLPNRNFVPTQVNRFSESLNFNPQKWKDKKGVLGTISKFYNQTSLLVERRVLRDGNRFDLNPFASGDDNLLGLQFNFRNSLFFNRAKQRHTVVYTFHDLKNRSLLSVGSQENNIQSHQLQYSHLVQKTWLLQLLSKTSQQDWITENFALRNFTIQSWQVQSKIGYLWDAQANIDLFYEFQQKNNQLADFEQLQQHRIGLQANYIGAKKMVINGEFSYFQNQFKGMANTPVAFQMLEGLQPGQNLVWRLLVQKNLTDYLDLNINYQGRKSETSQAIHTGSVQLRAFF